MNVGGPAVQVTGLMGGLPSDLFEQRLIIGECGPDEVDYVKTQAPDIPVTVISELGRTIRPLDDVRAFIRLVKEIRRFQPDIIHTHTAKAGFVGRLAAQFSRGPVSVVHTYHGHLLHGYFGPLATRLVVLTERLLERISDHLVAVGEQVRADLLVAGIGNRTEFSVINPGIELPAVPSRDDSARELGLDPSKRYLAFIGRVTRIKRPDRWPEIASTIIKDFPETGFLVVGDGDELEKLQQHAAQAHLPFHFLGTRSDITTVLAIAEGVILTSDNEGTPISLIEAGMAGLPVVATDVGSVAEVVQEGVTGWLTTTDVDQIVRAASELLGNPTEAASRGKRARLLAQETFGFERFIRDYAKLYLGLIGRSNQK